MKGLLILGIFVFTLIGWGQDAPNLLVNHANGKLILSWDTGGDEILETDVEVLISGKQVVAKMDNGVDTLEAKSLDMVNIDPESKLALKSTWEEKKALRGQLLSLGGIASIWEISARHHFTQAYFIEVSQELDHFSDEPTTFNQRVWMSFVDPAKPTLMETCGYEGYDYTKEIAHLTKGNQLIIENRFFGTSKALGEPRWELLRAKQAVEDLHRINKAFKKIFIGKWVSSGISKGGANCITYRAAYPNDVDVTVPYVAPIALDREDQRTTEYINTRGEKSCRDSLIAFQRMLLNRREEILPVLKEWAAKKEMKFSVGYETALEYAAYEYTFSFWQWFAACDKTPGYNATPQAIFDHVNETVGWSFYSDKTILKLYPSYYQHMVELGYYGFQKKDIYDLIKVVKEPDNLFFCPDGIKMPSYDGTYVKNVADYATNKGNNFIYIYGEYDIWSACAITPASHLNSLKMVKEKGTHGTRIKHFSEEDKQKIYKALGEWLECEITPLK